MGICVCVCGGIIKESANWSVSMDCGKRNVIGDFVEGLVWASYTSTEAERSNISVSIPTEAIDLQRIALMQSNNMTDLDPISIEVTSITDDSDFGGAIRHLYAPLVGLLTPLW